MLTGAYILLLCNDHAFTETKNVSGALGREWLHEAMGVVEPPLKLLRFGVDCLFLLYYWKAGVVYILQSHHLRRSLHVRSGASGK